VEQGERGANRYLKLDEVKDEVCEPVGGEPHSTQRLNMLELCDSLNDEVADDLGDNERESNAGHENNRASVCCVYPAPDHIRQRHRCVSSLELKLRVTCGDLEDRLIHELGVQAGTIHRSHVSMADEFVLVLVSVSLIKLVGA